MLVRSARPEEAGPLTELVLRSKAHWGYDEAFMAACRLELTLGPEDLVIGRAVVAERDGELLGMATLEGDAPHGSLGMLFVDPAAMGQGVGSLLYRHVVSAARELGFRSLSIDSDPNAAPFYARLGAVRIGETPSGSVPGRVLPLFRITVDG
ncbi:GNAT family N-acetyltransferase [Kitasatospora sp. NPDC052896]|uniref:GNAT family N-acetyltransferase n=1 Tax=Kitasatospora sp. NPDC052896 TaxID=3364061 RepID=UPI0037C5930F